MPLPFAFLRLDFQIAKQYRFRLFSDVLQSFFTVLLFYYVSKSIGPTKMFRGEYFPYLIVGIAYSRFYQSLSSSALAKIYDLQFLNLLDVFFVLPYRRWQIILSMGYPSILRDFLQFILYFSFAVYFVGINTFFTPNANVLWLLLSIVFLLIFSQLFTLIGIYSVLMYKRVNIVSLFSNLMMAMLTGVYFPIEILPTWLQAFAQFLPFTQILAMFRLGLGTNVTSFDPLFSVSVLSGMAVLLAAFTVFFCSFANHYLQKKGSLASI